MIQVIDETSMPSAFRWSTKELIRIASGYDSVLDVGCGTGGVIKSIKAKVRYGVDACEKALQAAGRGNNGVKFRRLDLVDVVRGSASLPVVDCVIGMDIVEHLFKEDAALLILHCEGIARKCLLWFIPVGNHPQTKDDRGFGNDHYQTHRSRWHPEEMDRLGYDVWYYPNWHRNIRPPKEKGAMWCQKVLE